MEENKREQFCRRNQQKKDFCDHIASGCGKDDPDGEVPIIWRRD